MGKPKGNVRIRWREDCIKCFLEACIHEVTKIGRKEGSLHKCSWIHVQKQLQEVCNLKVTQKQMKNVYDYLKWKFLGWAYLKQEMGIRYKSKTNTFNLTNEEWKEFIKDHPKAKTLKSSPLIFPNLCTLLFERTLTLGEFRWSPSSTLPRSRVSPSSLKSPNIQLLAIEDISNISKECETQNPSTLESPSIQLLAIEDTPHNNQEGRTQNPSTLNPANIQLLEIEDTSNNSQEGGTQNRCTVKSPNIQLLEIEDVPGNNNDQDGGTQNPSILKSPNIKLVEIEDVPNNDQECGTQNPSAQCSQSTTFVPSDNRERPSVFSDSNGERLKKKGKTAMKFSRLEEDMSNALKVFFKSHVGPSQNECVDKLNRLGWAKNSPSYVAALGIFCEGPSYREGWMLLPTDNVELIKLWVESAGKKLGYM